MPPQIKETELEKHARLNVTGVRHWRAAMQGEVRNFKFCDAPATRWLSRVDEDDVVREVYWQCESHLPEPNQDLFELDDDFSEDR